MGNFIFFGNLGGIVILVWFLFSCEVLRGWFGCKFIIVVLFCICVEYGFWFWGVKNIVLFKCVGILLVICFCWVNNDCSCCGECVVGE